MTVISATFAVPKDERRKCPFLLLFLLLQRKKQNLKKKNKISLLFVISHKLDKNYQIKY